MALTSIAPTLQSSSTTIDPTKKTTIIKMVNVVITETYRFRVNKIMAMKALKLLMAHAVNVDLTSISSVTILTHKKELILPLPREVGVNAFKLPMKVRQRSRSSSPSAALRLRRAK